MPHPLHFDGRFLWHPQPDDAPDEFQYDYLPRDVFDRLDGFIQRENPRMSRMVKAYPTKDEAMAALARAQQIPAEWNRHTAGVGHAF